MAKSKTDASKNPVLAINIQRLKQVQMTARVIGTTPLYSHAMAVKAQRTLLLGGGRKTAAERVDIKHDPEHEYRSCCYLLAAGPTLLGMPAAAIKKAMATAAIVTPGIKRTEVERLLYIPGSRISIWGKPFLKMDVVRSADMARTPDIRTRAFLPQWVAEFELRYIAPQLNAGGVIALLANGGMVAGIGDNRQEQGNETYGTFEPVTDDSEAAFATIQQDGGRAIQQAAYDEPEYADEETAALMEMVRGERLRRAA